MCARVSVSDATPIACTQNELTRRNDDGKEVYYRYFESVPSRSKREKWSIKRTEFYFTRSAALAMVHANEHKLVASMRTALDTLRRQEVTDTGTALTTVSIVDVPFPASYRIGNRDWRFICYAAAAQCRGWLGSADGKQAVADTGYASAEASIDARSSCPSLSIILRRPDPRCAPDAAWATAYASAVDEIKRARERGLTGVNMRLRIRTRECTWRLALDRDGFHDVHVERIAGVDAVHVCFSWSARAVEGAPSPAAWPVEYAGQFVPPRPSEVDVLCTGAGAASRA